MSRYKSQIYLGNIQDKIHIRIIECISLENLMKNSNIQQKYKIEKFSTVQYLMSENTLWFYLSNSTAGTIFQFALHLAHMMQIMIAKYNIYILHGGCICNPSGEKATILFGDSGQGKSSIILYMAYFHNYKIITDDVLIVNNSSSHNVIEKNVRSIGIDEVDLETKYKNLSQYIERSPFEKKVRLNYEMYDSNAYSASIVPEQIVFLGERYEAAKINKLNRINSIMLLLKLHGYYGKDLPLFIKGFESLLKTCKTFILNTSYDITKTTDCLISNCFI